MEGAARRSVEGDSIRAFKRQLEEATREGMHINNKQKGKMFKHLPNHGIRHRNTRRDLSMFGESDFNDGFSANRASRRGFSSQRRNLSYVATGSRRDIRMPSSHTPSPIHTNTKNKISMMS